MKRVLNIALVFILLPSFFMIILYKEENNIIDVANNNVSVSSISNDNIKLIKVKQISKNKIITIDIESYVKGVIAGEMPLYFNEEALKAQAVAARTYAIRRINENSSYDVVDTVSNQVYIDDDDLKNRWGNNYEKNMDIINRVVDSTNGEYVDYNGTYADTLFFSTSTGCTENSEEIFGSKVAYLKSVSSVWDSDSPVYKEENIYTRSEFCSLLGINDCSLIYVDIIDETSTGRVKKLTINNKSFTGSSFAYLLGIRSNYFTIEIVNNKVLVTTKGYGHGVGMSQYGANGMANNGYSYKQILMHYYQGTTIKNIY